MRVNKYKNDLIWIAVTVVLSIIIVIGSKFIFKGGYLEDTLNQGVEYYQAEVIEKIDENLQEDNYLEGVNLGYETIKVKLLDGPYINKEYEITNNISRLYNIETEVGSKIIIAMYFQDNELSDIAVSSYKRSNALIAMSILFILIVVLIGGFKGVKSIVSLIFTIICIVFLMLPLMLRGINPIFAAIIIAALSTTATLILVAGISKKSLSAIIGTVLGVFISGVFAFVFGKWANLSGMTMSDSESIMYIAETSGLKIKGVMFAGILIASLGAVMDVSMSISSSIFEIKEINDKISVKDLFKSGMNIGRDIIGTMSNTLILAFAGGSINTLILIYAANLTANRMMNLEILGTEIIQGLAGSIGVVLTVPLTAIIASYLCRINKADKLKK